VIDGKDYPLTGSLDRLRSAYTVTLKRDGAHAFGGLSKKSGFVVMTNMRTVSKDGKTLKLVANGADSKGQQLLLTTV
jgi:NAD-dependent DNA ligase